MVYLMCTQLSIFVKLKIFFDVSAVDWEKNTLVNNALITSNIHLFVYKIVHIYNLPPFQYINILIILVVNEQNLF